MEDEDIKIVEELVCKKYSETLLNTLSMAKEEDEVYILTINERQAIENLLSRLKTAERMNDVLASTTYDYANLEMLNICPAEYEGKVDLRKCKQFGKDINCIKCIKEWARKKVEDGNKQRKIYRVIK